MALEICECGGFRYKCRLYGCIVLRRGEPLSTEMPGGAMTWDEAEEIAPECSPRWDADGMGEWQGSRIGPYLHLSWNRDQCLVAVVHDPHTGDYAAARWDGPIMGWKADAATGSLHDVMRVRSLVEETVDTSKLRWHR